VVELDRSAIDGLAARVLASGMAPAVALAVTGPDRTLLARTYGEAPHDALWPVASIGKSFTAAAALQRVEEGLLDLHHLLTPVAARARPGARPVGRLGGGGRVRVLLGGGPGRLAEGAVGRR
jgi:CubicO group peptidase (beta-lactamase class C family)